MSYSPPSFPTDYDQLRQWNDTVFQQHHTAHLSPRFYSNSTPNSQFDAAYHSGTKAWDKSTVTVGSSPIWSSEQYNAVSSPGESAYTEEDIQHSSYTDETHVDQHNRYLCKSSPNVTEGFNHQGDMVASPINETPYYIYPAYNDRQYDLRSSFAREWAQEVRMTSQGSTGVPDEYRASIARRSDEVHASGLHGLEGDNDVVHFRRYGGSCRPYKAEEAELGYKKAESKPIQFHPQAEWNLEVASDAFDSLVGLHSLYDPSTHANAGSLPESPMIVPSQQHTTDYLYDQKQLSRSPDGFSPHILPTPAPLMNHLPPPPIETPSFLPGSASSQRYPPVSASPPCQGLEYHRSSSGSGSGSGPGSASPSRQQSVPSDTAYPGSSQSVLKMTTPKKVTEKKQALACLFCRERKIACGRPDPESDNQTCNQCARRHIECEYPKESRRGQHKRTRRKATHDHDVNQSSPRSVS